MKWVPSTKIGITWNFKWGEIFNFCFTFSGETKAVVRRQHCDQGGLFTGPAPLAERQEWKQMPFERAMGKDLSWGTARFSYSNVSEDQHWHSEWDKCVLCRTISCTKGLLASPVSIHYVPIACMLHTRWQSNTTPCISIHSQSKQI